MTKLVVTRQRILFNLNLLILAISVVDLITKSDIKEYAGIDHSDDDSRISTLASVVSEWFKERTKRSFEDETRTEYYDGGGHSIVLVNRPLNSITHIKDTFKDNPSDIDSDLYYTDDKKGIIYRQESVWGASRNTASWPEGDSRWEVKYDAGYGTTTSDIQSELGSLKFELSEIALTIYNEPDLSIVNMQSGDESASRKLKKKFESLINKYSAGNRAI